MNFLTVLLEGAPVLTQTADKAANESLNIIDLAMKGGWIMVVLALLSVVGAYIFFERFMALRKSMEKDGRLNDRVKDNLMENDVKSAYNYCQKLNTPVSRMLAKGVKDFNLDSPSIRQALENTAALEIANLEKGLPFLSTIAAVAPMLGFLGTVTGMVQAFWNMSNAGNNVDISLLSGGIYEAMITTVGGLIVGIIAIFAYNYLVTQVDKMQNLMEAEMIAFLEIVTECKENIAKKTVAPQPVVAEQPAVAPQPVVVEQPVVAPQPVVVEQPVVAPQPAVVAEQPAVVPQPVVVEQPVVAPQPVVVEQPVVAPQPVVVEQPAVAPQPVAVAQPAQPVAQPVQPIAQPVQPVVTSVSFNAEAPVTPLPVQPVTPKPIIAPLPSNDGSAIYTAVEQPSNGQNPESTKIS